MKITILFFGIVTDLIGKSSLDYTFDHTNTVRELKAALIERYPALQNINDFAIAVNESYAEDFQEFSDGDTIAIIPPVSGG